MKKLLK